jgi:hypothetical protein
MIAIRSRASRVVARVARRAVRDDSLRGKK